MIEDKHLFPARSAAFAIVRHSRWMILLMGAAFVAATAGCGDDDGIVSYQAPKVESSLASAGRDRMLAAMVMHDGTAWFFKMTGPDETVQDHAKSFEQLVKSVTFSEGKPAWRLPAGWKQEAGSNIRFATLRAPGPDAPLELTVIPLPIPEGEPAVYVHSNVNRWREQLGLPPIAADKLAKETNRFTLGGGDAAAGAENAVSGNAMSDEVVMVNLVGKLSGSGMGQAPFAPFAGGAPMADHPPIGDAGESAVGNARAGSSTGAGGLQFTTPAGWTPGRGSAFSLAAFQVADGDKHVEITVSTAGGDLLANINRWRGQVGLADVGEEELQKSIQPIELAGGQRGAYVALEGPQETILGVAVVSGGRTWFVKLRGDGDLAAREKANFEAFTRSLRLP